jgi:hypothetical protein
MCVLMTPDALLEVMLIERFLDGLRDMYLYSNWKGADRALK